MRNMTLDLRAGVAIESLWLVMHVSLFFAVGSSYSPWHLCVVFVGTWPEPLNLRSGAARPKIAAPLGTRWKRVKGLRCLVWSFDSCVSSEKVCFHNESWVSCGACGGKASHVAGGRCSRAVSHEMMWVNFFRSSQKPQRRLQHVFLRSWILAFEPTPPWTCVRASSRRNRNI